MSETYCKIKYRKAGGFYAGLEYTYQTRLPLMTGDKVIAPTAKEPRQRGIVTAVNVPEPGFACRSITEYDPDAEIEQA